MNYRGFEIKKSQHGYVIDFVMPDKLYDEYFARLYCRGSLNDIADGEPHIDWNIIKTEYSSDNIVAPMQVHKTEIIDCIAENSLPHRDEADGVFIDLFSTALASLRFADCTPVVIAGIGEKSFMCALHSGFKGTLLNICSKAVSLAMHRTNCSAENIFAWIGPAIGYECYSRKKEDPVTREAVKIFDKSNYLERGDYYYFDIKNEIKYRLNLCGLLPDRIYTFDACTYCKNEYFYSYRAGEKKKRNFLLCGLKKFDKTCENIIG